MSEKNRYVRLEWEGKRPVVLIVDEDGDLRRLSSDIKCICLQVSNEISDSEILPRIYQMMKTRGRFFFRITDFFKARRRRYLLDNGIAPLHEGFAEVVIVEQEDI